MLDTYLRLDWNVFFCTIANINPLGLMIQKSFGAIFSVEVKGHFGVIQCRRT